MKFMGSTWEENKRKYQHVDTLEVAEALPSASAVMFFYGPVALARDARISKQDIFSAVPDPDQLTPNLRRLSSQAPFWKSFEVDFRNGTSETFCDFSSAGNSWDNDSKFNTWCLLTGTSEGR